MFVIFLGLNHNENEYNFLNNNNIFIKIDSENLKNTENINKKIKNIINILSDFDINKYSLIGHSIGIIFLLYIVKILNLNNKIILIDPITKYIRSFVSNINNDILKLYDECPKIFNNDILVISYYPKMYNLDEPYRELSEKVLNRRIEAIKELFENKVKIKFLTLPKKLKFIPHNIHLIVPDQILFEINSFI